MDVALVAITLSSVVLLARDGLASLPVPSLLPVVDLATVVDLLSFHSTRRVSNKKRVGVKILAERTQSITNCSHNNNSTSRL